MDTTEVQKSMPKNPLAVTQFHHFSDGGIFHFCVGIYLHSLLWRNKFPVDDSVGIMPRFQFR
jgi:hypothetical protein